jgi:hypothetical protein
MRRPDFTGPDDLFIVDKENPDLRCVKQLLNLELVGSRSAKPIVACFSNAMCLVANHYIDIIKRGRDVTVEKLDLLRCSVTDDLSKRICESFRSGYVVCV